LLLLLLGLGSLLLGFLGLLFLLGQPLLFLGLFLFCRLSRLLGLTCLLRFASLLGLQRGLFLLPLELLGARPFRRGRQRGDFLSYRILGRLGRRCRLRRRRRRRCSCFVLGFDFILLDSLLLVVGLLSLKLLG